MVFLHVFGHAGRSTDVRAAWLGATPPAMFESLPGDRTFWPVAVLSQQLWDRAAVLDGKQSCLGGLVVAAGEELAKGCFFTATTPTHTRRN